MGTEEGEGREYGEEGMKLRLGCKLIFKKINKKLYILME